MTSSEARFVQSLVVQLGVLISDAWTPAAMAGNFIPRLRPMGGICNTARLLRFGKRYGRGVLGCKRCWSGAVGHLPNGGQGVVCFERGVFTGNTGDLHATPMTTP